MTYHHRELSRPVTDAEYIKQAIAQYYDQGTLEIDSNAVVSHVDGTTPVHGAYVAAWVWVNDEDTDVPTTA